ncbi:unnamed protein product [Adineta steineri]|uniref:Circularly permuted ATPgrasp domain-containing protein n=1 Tax=Adineta steineri TaxID=433720 RepID=A0A815P0F8_9BILA|nr:unnamed protein product [Adineta steineri]CAF1443029.1 unnamed protein product [Adineta steineri]
MEDENIRKDFTSKFSDEKYKDFLNKLNSEIPSPIDYRIAESPLFLNKDVSNKLIKCGEEILDFLLRPDLKQITEKSIPDKWRCPNENDHSHFIGMDFALSKDKDGNFSPKLIEFQGFSGLYGIQAHLANAYKEIYNISDEWSIYRNGLDETSYFNLLKQIIVGPYELDEVILMDVHPHEQHTAADFYFTKIHINIPIVGLEDLKQDGKKLFYEINGEKKYIKRIYNRLIFDEIDKDENIFEKNVDIRQDLDVEWITHPNWWYRISKYLLPHLKGDYILKSFILNDIINNLPNDLENYVLKPLFSFGGNNVIIDIKQDDIQNIKDPQNWILQQKAKYEPVMHIEGNDVIAEIRLMYFWPDKTQRPILTANNTRLSTGNMINVGSNKNKKWAGATVTFMQK